MISQEQLAALFQVVFGHRRARRHEFTDCHFLGLLRKYGIPIGMDGNGCWRDEVFGERPWKTIQYEQVYLHAYAATGAQLRARVGRSGCTVLSTIVQLPHSPQIGEEPKKSPPGGSERARGIPMVGALPGSERVRRSGPFARGRLRPTTDSS